MLESVHSFIPRLKYSVATDVNPLVYIWMGQVWLVLLLCPIRFFFFFIFYFLKCIYMYIIRIDILLDWCSHSLSFGSHLQLLHSGFYFFNSMFIAHEFKYRLSILFFLGCAQAVKRLCKFRFRFVAQSNFYCFPLQHIVHFTCNPLCIQLLGRCRCLFFIFLI